MRKRDWRKIITNIGVFSLIVVVSIVLVRCGGSSSGIGMGSANVTLSDPPSCTNYSHVWVTVDGVSANISSNSNSGWQSLVSNLNSTVSSSNPKIVAVQLDLMNLPDGSTQPQIQCLLSQLGSTSSLPVGDYQQIRLQLVPNNASPSDVELVTPGGGEAGTNQCGNAWNCVYLNGQTNPTTLELSSQAQTGLKIPPGQIMGGPIHVAAGQSVDINIDFNACRSVVSQGPSRYRLNPTLVAYQTSQNLTGISGQVVQGSIVNQALQVPATPTPVPGANVALEISSGNPMDGSSNVDLISSYLKMADTNGNFDFCPLPSGATFDVVSSANVSGSTSGGLNASILTGVPGGTQVTVPLLAVTSSPGSLTGDVDATAADNNATMVSTNVYALQMATNSLEFAVPLLTGSTPTIAQFGLTSCTSGKCTGTYTLNVPASDPLVGQYSMSGVTWTLPTSQAQGSYKVEATCNANASSDFSSSQTVMDGASTSISTALNLTGCN